MNNDTPHPFTPPDGAELQQRIAELEQELARLHDQVETDYIVTRNELLRLRVFEELVEHARDSVIVGDTQGQLVYVNRAWQTLSGYGTSDLGMDFLDMVTPEDRAQALNGFQAVVTTGAWEGRLTYQRRDGSTFSGQVSAFLISDYEQVALSAVAFVRDVTAQVEAEAEREALQQQIIAVQQEALRELATPLIPVADGVIVLPLVGTMSGDRAQQVMETLLEGIATYQAEFAILDVTGVRVVDTRVAQGLLRAAQAAKLLGTRVIVTGISAEIAQTLVYIGANLSDITTRNNLQNGIAYALGNE